MPLHDWTDRPGWEGMHAFWTTEIVRDLRGSLPPGYRAVIGSNPLVTIDAEQVKPDVAVTEGPARPPAHPAAVPPEPEVEVEIGILEEDLTVQVERNGRLVAVVELVSPRNKDRPSARSYYGGRYTNYLRAGAHLLLVDVHRRPVGFGFSQLLAVALSEALPARPAPVAVSYRVGPGLPFHGRTVAVWSGPLAVGEPLPPMTLAVTTGVFVTVDLENTYMRAARDNYTE